MPSVSEKTDRLGERTQCGQAFYRSDMSPAMKMSVLSGRSWVTELCPVLEAAKHETEARE